MTRVIGKRVRIKPFGLDDGGYIGPDGKPFDSVAWDAQAPTLYGRLGVRLQDSMGRFICVEAGSRTSAWGTRGVPRLKSWHVGNRNARSVLGFFLSFTLRPLT